MCTCLCSHITSLLSTPACISTTILFGSNLRDTYSSNFHSIVFGLDVPLVEPHTDLGQELPCHALCTRIPQGRPKKERYRRSTVHAASLGITDAHVGPLMTEFHLYIPLPLFVPLSIVPLPLSVPLFIIFYNIDVPAQSSMSTFDQ